MTKTQSLGMNMIKICSNAHLKHRHLKVSLLLFLSATRTVNTVNLLINMQLQFRYIII